jgi:putative endonuclease
LVDARRKVPCRLHHCEPKNGTIYIGLTSALWNRIAAHKTKSCPGFSAEYNITNLVWYEHHHTMEAAIKREKQLKKWNRSWKLELIEKLNPEWRDLHDEIDTIGTLVEIKQIP